MANEQKLEQAQAIFEALCFALEEVEWDYSKDISGLQIESRVWGDDIPMDIGVKIDAENMLFILKSELPFEVKTEKKADMALAVSMINNNLQYGNFDYDLKSEKVYFRTTGSFLESSISVSLFKEMLEYSVKVIDDYNDKLLLLGDGLMTLEEFSIFLTNLLEKEVDKKEGEEKDIVKAKEIYNKICTILGRKNLEYVSYNEEMSVNFTVIGEDLPMEISMRTNKETQYIELSSQMPYKISVDNRVQCALAVCSSSAKMELGSFDYDIINGIIKFRVTTPFKDSTISRKLIENIIEYSSEVVDKYNDRFLALDKGFLKLEDFIN